MSREELTRLREIIVRLKGVTVRRFVSEEWPGLKIPEDMALVQQNDLIEAHRLLEEASDLVEKMGQ